MKLVVVGGVAGGASVAARVRRLQEKAEIIIFERGQHVSYSNCALPYYLSGAVEEEEDLVLMTPEDFRHQHNIDVRTCSEVTVIDRQAKTVTVKNYCTGEEYQETYDKLVLSPGAAPILPRSIAGIERENVFTIRNVTDIAKVKACMDRDDTKNVVVVGGGFIGIETAENLKAAGKNVAVIEGMSQILAPFDHDMVQYLHKELMDNGVALYLDSTLTAIEEGQVRAVHDGAEFTVPADAVVMAIGVAPETALVTAAGLEVGATRGIKVNRHFQTADPDIYAVGDAIESYNALTGQNGRLALAGPAQRQARIAANHICGENEEDPGFIGSSCIRVFSLNAASTGLNERAAKAAGIEYESVLVYPNDKVGIMPESNYLGFKLLFAVPSGKILGAQAIGVGEADKRVNMIAALLTMNGTVADLKRLEHCYAPLFSTAKDVVQMAALVAENILAGRLRQVYVSEVRALVESGAYIVDVRDEDEFEEGHIIGAHNVPLPQLRQRMDEIPRDIPVYLHCRSSHRSYYAYRTLVGNGYNNVTNISGSFLGLSLYEYFTDKQTGRKPIVTDYNFE